MDFERICQDIADIAFPLYDLAIYKNGQIYEHRFQPCNICNNGYSVTKAFIVTAIGMLHDDGLLDVKRPLRDYMADLMPPDLDPIWDQVTVEHAMLHRIGFDEGFLDIDVEDASQYPTQDFLDMVFRHPITHQPGEHRQYSDAAYYLLSRLISCVSGQKADTLLNHRLLAPLKFREAAWSRCPQDYPIGATGLYCSSADMVKLPALYLEGGLWQGQRIISEAWVNTVIDNGYEFTPKSPNGLIGKGGMYGQMIMLSREKQFAVAWHGFNTDSEKGRRLNEYIDQLF